MEQSFIVCTFVNENKQEFLLCDKDGRISIFNSKKDAERPFSFYLSASGLCAMGNLLQDAVMEARALEVTMTELQEEIPIPFTIKESFAYMRVWGIELPESCKFLREKEEKVTV